MRSMFRCPLILLVLVGYIAISKCAWASSLRCPHVLVGVLAPVAPATIGTPVPEAPEIAALWQDLSDPTPASDGNPLGCPIGPVTEELTLAWVGVTQRFQRGTILVGRKSFAGFEVAAIRGLGGWTVWWKGPATAGLGPYLVAGMTSPFVEKMTVAPAAIWAHGGNVVTSGATETVALWECRTSPCVIQGGSAWEQITPLMTGQSRPFDAAEALMPVALSNPDITQRTARHDAIFAAWLPCFTRLVLDGKDPDEDALARPTVMMRKANSCKLTGNVPRTDVINFLASFSFPDGQLPGTNTDDSHCGRNGDLDVTLVQLLHLIFEYQGQIDLPTLNHLRDILTPWGGSPRADPYITPSGTCLGFGVIESENHIMLQESARYLINVLLNGRQPTNSTTNADWLVRFMQQLVRRDMYEFNALPYTRYHMKALLLLHDYAPDPTVATSARGVLDWLFAKQAISRNLDRDHRPYRRLPNPDIYAETEWWSHASTATTTQAALLIGPMQHIHRDVDLEISPDGKVAFNDTVLYPQLGTGSEVFLAEFCDVMDTKYVFPAALLDWFERRFTDDPPFGVNDVVNRLTYVQAINHASPVADDPRLWRQASSGVEILSGNRNWTMTGGGGPAPPGDPGPPPEGGAAEAGYIIGGGAAGLVAGAAVGGTVFGPPGAVAGGVVGLIGGLISGAVAPATIAANTQTSHLWSSQTGLMRETNLIPSAVGLDRAQTIRFSAPIILAQGQDPIPRLCVAEGFMCGFDLEMPSHPFPARDQSQCPIAFSLPQPLKDLIATDDEDGRPVLFQFGCLVQKPAEDMRSWSIWTFEHAMLAMANSDTPGQERIAAIWVEDVTNERRVRIRVKLPGHAHDWFNYDIYNTSVETSSGDPPGGGIRYTNTGNVDDLKKWETGEAIFTLAGVNDRTWYLIASGCDPKYGFLGIRTGHTCHADILPKLSVSVDIPPLQPFSCAAHSFRDGSLVLEVGNTCSESQFGLFVYIWTAGCTDRCPSSADEYGFVVAAPSRGWTWEDFAAMVESSISNFAANNHPYLPRGISNSVNIPISPPVRNVSPDALSPNWHAIGPPTFHTVTFQWDGANHGQSQILTDSGAALTFGPLAADWAKWPTALGHVTAPDAGVATELLHSNGSGCFSLAGLATGAQPDPVGLLVDLRDSKAPSIVELRTSALAASCP